MFERYFSEIDFFRISLNILITLVFYKYFKEIISFGFFTTVLCLLKPRARIYHLYEIVGSFANTGNRFLIFLRCCNVPLWFHFWYFIFKYLNIFMVYLCWVFSSQPLNFQYLEHCGWHWGLLHECWKNRWMK